MKQILTLLARLLLAPLAVLHAASSPDSRIVIASEAGAKLDSDVTKGGGTDDTALIQSILDRAPKIGTLKLVVDGPILVKGLKVHSNTTIECLNRACGFYLADNSNRPLIANATPQPEGRADRNLSLLLGICFVGRVTGNGWRADWVQRREGVRLLGICFVGRVTGNGWRADWVQRREGV